MGRPAKEKSEQRQQIGFRLDPADRARLDAVAQANGRSVGQEVEARIVASLDYDDRVDVETRELIAAILKEIEVIQTLTKKRWHKHVTTWAAVHQMFRQGPLQWKRPDRPSDDELVSSIGREIHEKEKERVEISDEIRELGVAVLDAPKSRGGLFGNFNSRNAEKSAIASIENAEMKEVVSALFEKILILDNAIRDLNAEYVEASRPYWDAERGGRNLYRRHRRAVALQSLNEGKPFHIEDIVVAREVE